MNAKLLAMLAVAAISVACSKQPSFPDDGFVDVPGGRVAFRVLGSGSTIPVLLIHGIGVSSCSFVDNVDGIAKERPVILYDQLGSGYSDRIENLEQHARLPRFVDEIDAIRAELALTELHLVGHSWGAAVALEYLLTERPTGIRSAVFVSPFFGAERWIDDIQELLVQLPGESADAIRATIESGDFEASDYQAAAVLFNSLFLMRPPYEQLNLDACAREPRGGSEEVYRYIWGDSDIVPTGTLREFDRIGHLSELTAPVLFVTGEFDEARPGTVAQYQALVDGSRFEVLPDAGHMVYLDQPELFNTVLADFFREVESQH